MTCNAYYAISKYNKEPKIDVRNTNEKKRENADV